MLLLLLFCMPDEAYSIAVVLSGVYTELSHEDEGACVREDDAGGGEEDAMKLSVASVLVSKSPKSIDVASASDLRGRALPAGLVLEGALAVRGGERVADEKRTELPRDVGMDTEDEDMDSWFCSFLACLLPPITSALMMACAGARAFLPELPFPPSAP